jgi:hypothetical protein
MRTSENTAAIAEALAKAQASIANPSADQQARIAHKGGGSHSYSYASLAALMDLAREALSPVGIAVTQEAIGDTTTVGVITRLSHSSGEWMELGPWSTGVTTEAEVKSRAMILTSLRRHHIVAALGLALVEGDAAGERAPAPEDEPPIEQRQSMMDQDQAIAAVRQLGVNAGMTPTALDSYVDNTYGKPIRKLSPAELAEVAVKLRDTAGELSPA